MPEDNENLEETPNATIPVSSSILNSIKLMLDLIPENKEFDEVIIIHINSAFFTLQQLGVGPLEGFTIKDESTTYEDYLGEGSILIAPVKTYLYMKTKIGFDNTISGTLKDSLKEMIKEAEVRFLYQVDTLES